jgi:hypothetical protein
MPIPDLEEVRRTLARRLPPQPRWVVGGWVWTWDFIRLGDPAG